MKFLLLIITLIIISCSYSVYMSAYPHLERISVKTFENKTNNFEIDTEIYNSLNEQYRKDGRLTNTDLNPDCILTGKIIDYKNIWKTINQNTNTEEYEIQMLLEVEFIDNINNVTIYKNDQLKITSKYYPNSDIETEIKTEELARDDAYKKLFEAIMKNTLEKW